MAVLEIGLVVEYVAGIAVDALSQGLSRNEAVVSALKKVGLDTVLNPQDFDSAYVYAVVEFGVYKPSDVLNIFRDSYVREAFQSAFYEGKIAEFQREIQAFADRLVEQRRYYLDAKVLTNYVREFCIIFERIVAYSRTPAQAEDHLHILTIHESVKKIYLDIQSLKGQPTTADQIAHDKPDYWEYLLAFEILRAGLSNVKRSYNELRAGIVYRQHRRISQPYEVRDWLISRMDDVSYLLEMATAILDTKIMPAFGPPGVSGNEVEIRYACNKFIEVANLLFELEIEWTFTTLPEELDEVTQILRFVTEPFVLEFEKIPQGFVDGLRTIVNMTEGEERQYVINIVFEPPTILNKCVPIVTEWYFNNSLL